MDMRVQNKTLKAEKIAFYFSANPPALSIVTDQGESYWFEVEDELQIIALEENASMHVNKRLRVLLAKEGRE